MKRKITSIISALLALAMLAGVSCNGNTTNVGETTEESNTETVTAGSEETTAKEDTDESSSTVTTEEESETVTVEEFVDRSGDFIFNYGTDNKSAITVTCSGKNNFTNRKILFDGDDDGFMFSSFSTSGYHDIASCADCEYEEYNGTTAFHICNNNRDYSSVSVVLDTPIPPALVKDISMTFMTSDDADGGSQIRMINSKYATINLNTTPALTGATEEWKTVEFALSPANLDEMAEDDGLIHELRFLFRDKDNISIYIKEFTLILSVENLCRINLLEGNYFNQGSTLDALANQIVANFNAADIGADIDIRCTSFRQSTSLIDGLMSYRIKLTSSDGESVTYSSLNVTVSKIKGAWLTVGHKTFFAERDAKSQWETNFDPSGILFLEDNVLKARERLETVEYAVIGADTDVTDTSVIWLAPQYLTLSENGISSFFANAPLEYGSSLTEGSDYRFVVRGITKNNNYILHLDIPFTYSPFSPKVIGELDAANKIIAASSLKLDKDQENKPELVRTALKALIGNDNIDVAVSYDMNGVLSGSYKVSLVYSAPIESERFPEYRIDGAARSDFFAYTGNTYTSVISIVYEDQTSNIKLVSPADGETGLRVASDEVVRLWDSDISIITTDAFGYKTGEQCAPSPITLKWTDSKPDKDEVYVVFISESADFESSWTFVTSETSLDVYNLKAGQRYFWMVESTKYTSATFTFVTEAGYPRYILTDGVSNFRDIGGHVTLDGKIVKQGLAFRLSNFDSVSSSDTSLITQKLGVITDLDLRGESTVSPLGNGVTARPISIKWYNGIFNEGEGEKIREAISVFANEANYPIGYHCAIGRDRTGTVTILILGLLGVDQDTILKEFMLSKLSVSGNGGIAPSSLLHNYNALVNGINKYGDEDDSFKEKVEAYLLDIGVTAEEIASIRSILLEDPTLN